MIIAISSIISHPTNASGIIVYCTSASSENLIIFGDRFLFVSCPVCLIRRNGPFAANGHMVQNPPCWSASYALGHPKQNKKSRLTG